VNCGFDGYPGADSICRIEDVLKQALALLRIGNTNRALDCLKSHIDLTWNHSFACYLAGLIHVNLDQDAAALPFYDRAIELNEDYADAIEARARLIQRAGRLEEALGAYDALSRFRPVDALAAKAAIWHELGRNEDAGEAYRQLTELNPSDASAWYHCGAILAGQGEQAEALGFFEKALERDPAYSLALYGAASALNNLGRLGEALDACSKLLAKAPLDFNAWFLCGNILYASGRAGEALGAFNKALALKPEDLGTLCNKGATLRQLGRLPEAEAMFREALAKSPRCLEALLGQGIVEFKSGRIEEALASFSAVLEAGPASATAHCGRGLALQELGRFDEAMSAFKRSLALNSELAEGHSNLGAPRLLLGDFEHGWEGYEYRKLWGGECKIDAKAVWPVWNGEPIAGKKLLIFDEAAHGDIIMLARYFPMLAELGAEATFQCRPRMLELLKKVPGVRLVTETRASEQFDYQVHLFSLPRAFKTRPGIIPAPIPYIESDVALASKWAAKIGSHGFKIGVAWQGNPDPKVDMARAAPLLAFGPLAEIPNVRLISLQKGFGSEQIESSGVKVESLGEEFDSGPHAFLDTAAVMANLDLIVSVDTSVAHLAGAMGQPIFVALKHVPEWRWMLNRSDSPWYPTMRLFRQQARGDWSAVFAAIAGTVAAMSSSRTMQPSSHPLPIPGAAGELFDKISILEIKAERIPDPRKRANVERELSLLRDLRENRGLLGGSCAELAAELRRTNLALWEIEDAIRRCERLGDFGPGFIELARSVYKENDKRAALKRQINELFASAIVEEKYFTMD
jgi:tetratricopeptide (TPR) repeat protein